MTHSYYKLENSRVIRVKSKHDIYPLFYSWNRFRKATETCTSSFFFSKMSFLFKLRKCPENVNEISRLVPG